MMVMVKKDRHGKELRSRNREERDSGTSRKRNDEVMGERRCKYTEMMIKKKR